MAVTPNQPTLPPEGDFTDPELNFIDESPPGLFPDNQDSNLGYRRKIYSDEIQGVYDQLSLIYQEAFPQTSTEFLDEWEREVGLPMNPSGKDIPTRRINVINRLIGGPFTHALRKAIVENYITATFGEPIQLLPAGVPMVAAGVPLYNEPGDVANLYRIIETVINFKYEVRINAGLAIDQNGLQRDLNHFTPAGIQPIFTYPADSTVFPCTPVLDDFLRANMGPTLSPSWSSNPDSSTAMSGLKVNTNQASGNGAGINGEWFDERKYGPDCECGITIPTVPPDLSDVALWLRLNNPGTNSATGYRLRLHKLAATDQIIVERLDPGPTYVQLGAVFTQEVSNGDSIGVRISGSTITAYYKAAAGSWTTLGTRTDATYTLAGYLGLRIDSTTARCDDFFGGKSTN